MQVQCEGKVGHLFFYVEQMFGTSKVGYEAWRRMRIGWRCWLICQFAACPVL